MGITTLALLLLASGAALAVSAAVVYSHPEVWARFSNTYLPNLGDKVDATETMFLLIIGAIVSLVVGTGLWFLQEPARWALLLVTGLPLGLRMISVGMTLFSEPKDLKSIADAFWFQSIALTIIVWYLLQPHVCRAFTGHGEFYDAYANVSSEGPDKERG
jgi:hypothetical protein